MRKAIDTNVVVRFLIDDGSDHSRAARVVFDETTCVIPISVVLETEWVLRSVFGVSRSMLAEALDRLLHMRNTAIADAEAVEMAVAAYRDGFDFADALHVALTQDCEMVVTFDKALRKRAGDRWSLQQYSSP
jgi:predicted nucleic-acid-binding protein